MGPDDRALFLSLRPAYADLLLSGLKTVELRRIRPRAMPGMPVLVYATSPVRQVLGGCVVEEIGAAAPDEIWRLHGHRTGVSRADFDAYFNGADTGVAITVSCPWRLDTPIDLTVMRARLFGFSPPQSFRYVSGVDAQELLGERWNTALLSGSARSAAAVPPANQRPGQHC